MRLPFSAIRLLGWPARLTAYVIALALLAQVNSAVQAKRPSSNAIKLCLSQPANDDGSAHGVTLRGAWVKIDGNWQKDFTTAPCAKTGDGGFTTLLDPVPIFSFDMLENWVDEDGDIWNNDERFFFTLDDTEDGIRITLAGTILGIDPPTKGRATGKAVIFFVAFNKKGENQWHRLDAVATFDAPGDPGGKNYPFGINPGESYTVVLTDWVMSKDVGSGKNAYEGPVPGGETTFLLTR